MWFFLACTSQNMYNKKNMSTCCYERQYIDTTIFIEAEHYFSQTWENPILTYADKPDTELFRDCEVWSLILFKATYRR